MNTEFVRTMTEKAVIVFLNDTVITDIYEATEEGQNYLEPVIFKKGQQINVELWQENNDRYQVLFIDDDREPIGWLFLADITIVDMTVIK